MHPTGSFERQGEVWVEYPPYGSGQNHRFKEARRDSDFIYLYDETRYEEGDPVRVLQIPFFMIKQSNDMISLIDGHDQRL